MLLEGAAASLEAVVPVTPRKESRRYVAVRCNTALLESLEAASVEWTPPTKRVVKSALHNCVALKTMKARDLKRFCPSLRSKYMKLRTDAGLAASVTQ